MQSSTILVLIFCSLSCVAFFADAHLCLLFPQQRGSIEGLNTAGATNCFQVQGPCGSVSPPNRAPIALLHKEYNVTFQKNLDHYNSNSPGSFVVSYSKNGNDFRPLAKIADTSDPSLTIYSVPIILSHADESLNGVIQVVYDTNNGVGPFYQCSNVNVFQP